MPDGNRIPFVPVLLKHTLNRLTTRMALAGIGPFSLIEHTGRRSGRVCRTPVILATVPEGFVAELTYGDQVDWYRNVVAAGGCRVLRGSREDRVVGVEKYDGQRGRAAYPAPARTVLALLRRTEFRLLRTERAPSDA